MKNIVEVSVSEIVIGERARQGYGFLDSLEKSIRRLGVLQPIGITPDKQLIFGGRRLQACKNLGMETIPARTFDIDADNPVVALQMERDENDQRVDLTPSEKVALATRIEESLVGRWGGDRKSRGTIVPLEMPQGKSSDIAAKSVNWSRETYRRAKTVVDSGDDGVIQEMDSGKKSVYAAYQEVRKPRERNKPVTFRITLYKNPNDDAILLMEKGGKDYCTRLGLALLKAAGHEVETRKKGGES